jgi:hypothetical protein
MKQANIKINDRVRITDAGECYTLYTEMFRDMGFKNSDKNPVFKTGEEAMVFNIAQHPSQPNTLYALVHDDGRECLISGYGIELVREVVVDRATIIQISDRLAQLESKLDQLAKHTMQPAKPRTAVEWLIEELTGFDYGDTEDYYDICLSTDKFTEIKTKALQMETKQNCK